MEGIFLLLGSNLGKREQVLLKARAALERSGIRIVKESSVYETAAWGKTDQQSFLNQVLKVETELSATDLLNKILSIEEELGRVRKIKWGERLIDIDILYYHDLICTEEDLKIPHPGIPDRKFTLIPLVEISPEQLHPEKKLSQSDLLDNCKDNLEVLIYSQD